MIEIPRLVREPKRLKLKNGNKYKIFGMENITLGL
jgi:hypothetical protein